MVIGSSGIAGWRSNRIGTVQAASSSPSAPPASASSSVSVNSSRITCARDAPERHPERHVTPAIPGAGQLDAGDVEAGHEQDDAGQSQQRHRREERSPAAPDP